MENYRDANGNFYDVTSSRRVRQCGNIAAKGAANIVVNLLKQMKDTTYKVFLQLASGGPSNILYASYKVTQKTVSSFSFYIGYGENSTIDWMVIGDY